MEQEQNDLVEGPSSRTERNLPSPIWDWVVSCKTDTWEYGRLYLDCYRSKTFYWSRAFTTNRDNGFFVSIINI